MLFIAALVFVLVLLYKAWSIVNNVQEKIEEVRRKAASEKVTTVMGLLTAAVSTGLFTTVLQRIFGKSKKG